MYLIVGLGNPGKEYENTRHNMGFKVLNKLSKKYNIPITKSKFNGKYGTGIIENEKVILLEPQTYMNLSGEAIKPMLDFYKVDYSNLLVIYDDIDVEPGKVKIRTKGGPGTHNGMKSVVKEIGTEEFPRIRVGIGQPIIKLAMIDYVIGYVPEKEYKNLKGLKKENLRDNMTNMELVLNMLAETSSTEISKSKKRKGFKEAEDSVIKGGNIARIAKEQLERETGKKVVSDKNAKEIRKLNSGEEQ